MPKSSQLERYRRLFDESPEPTWLFDEETLRFIDVNDAAANLIMGKVTLDNEEKRWLFVPNDPWKEGKYTLEILTTLEDLAGNKIGRAFDVDRFDQVQKRITSETYSLPFTIGSRAAPPTPTPK